MNSAIRHRAAFTLIEIMIVVAIIGILASIAIPGLLKAIDDSKRTACVADLKQIEGAKARWALEQRKPSTAAPTDAELFGVALYIQEKPSCHAGGVYTINTIDTRPTCSIPSHTW